MSTEEGVEVSINKESLFFSIGILCDMMIDFEDGFQLHPDENNETDDGSNTVNDYLDLIMSTLALLCEPLKNNPELIGECRNHVLSHYDIDIEDIIFGDEDIETDTREPHLTLVSDSEDE